jgi:hypothetical protein
MSSATSSCTRLRPLWLGTARPVYGMAWLRRSTLWYVQDYPTAASYSMVTSNPVGMSNPMDTSYPKSTSYHMAALDPMDMFILSLVLYYIYIRSYGYVVSYVVRSYVVVSYGHVRSYAYIQCRSILCQSLILCRFILHRSNLYMSFNPKSLGTI